MMRGQNAALVHTPRLHHQHAALEQMILTNFLVNFFKETHGSQSSCGVGRNVDQQPPDQTLDDLDFGIDKGDVANGVEAVGIMRLLV